MNQSIPHLAEDGSGVKFTVAVDFVDRDCIVSREALSKLARFVLGDEDLMEVFLAFEANIKGVARRMVAAGVPGSPLLLGERNFTVP